MRPTSPWVFGMFGLLLSLAASRAAHAEDGYRVSGPIVRGNLALYFVHGASRDGPVPLTLEEALAKKTVRVYELGSVNELAIENLGDEQVFVQAGDIVKGGRQDRALTASLILPPRSGRVPLAAFCVEQGRWSGRANQDPSQFLSAAQALPSRQAKLALRSAPLSARVPPRAGAAAPATAGAPSPASAPEAVSARRMEQEAVHEGQMRMWEEVSRIQQSLSNSLAAPVASPESQTSLALALENAKLREARTKLIDDAAHDKEQAAATEAANAAAQEPDVIGYVFAVNGELNSADVYPSAALFHKMWPKLLTAAATEAIIARNVPPDPTVPAFLRNRTPQTAPDKGHVAPTIDAVREFLTTAHAGKPSTWNPDARVEVAVHESEHALMFETRSADRLWVHRNYLAK